MASLPIIDISIFTKTQEESGLSKELYQKEKKSIARNLREACENIGFFYIVGHQVPNELSQTIHSLAKQFFQLDDSEKANISITKSRNFRGYQKLGQNVTKYQKDWHEAIDFFKEFSESDPRCSPDSLFGPNQWPSSPPEFRQTFENYIKEMNRVGATVMRCIALGLELDENFFRDNYIMDPFWGMRMIGYPPLESSQGQEAIGISCGEHCDYGCLTIVNQDATLGALQVRNTKNEWINADPVPGAFVMNLGDMLKVWTNNKYQSTPHQVINGGKTYRVSIPFFYEPDFEAMIEPLPVCCKDEPPKYSPVKYGNHLSSKVNSNFDWQFSKDQLK